MRVSVVMCTYNGERFLPEQLKSISQQTRVPDELIIFDDCSTDNTVAILKAFARTASFPVCLQQNECNLGVTSNFESALSQATGDIVFLCDQDDVWREDKVAGVSSIFENDPEVGMVVTDGEVVDETLCSTNLTLWEAAKMTPEALESFENRPFPFLVSHGNIVCGAASAFSKSVIALALPFPKKMAVLHDAWLAQVAACFTKVRSDSRQTVKYRKHANQATSNTAHWSKRGRSHFQAHYEQLVDLHYRLVRNPNKEILQVLQGNLDHLRARLTMPEDMPARIGAIYREASSGRYDRFSNGYNSIAKDLLLHV